MFIIEVGVGPPVRQADEAENVDGIECTVELGKHRVYGVVGSVVVPYFGEVVRALLNVGGR